MTHAPCDSASAQAAPGGQTGDRLVLAACILASSLAFVDGSVVNVGLPAIGQSLGGRAADLQWAVNAYMLPLSALLLLGGAAGDRFGRRRLLAGGVAVFVAASAGCAFAPDLSWLIGLRALQGLGAAMLLPNSLAILGGAFDGEAKGRAIGTWAAAGAVAGAIGPVLGGWLIDLWSWRAVFLVNLPVGAGAILLALRLPRDAIPAGKGAQPPALDWLGGVLATVGLGALTFGLTVGSGPGGWAATANIAMVVGALSLGAFVWVEHRRGDRAMAPLSLFLSKTFVGLSLLTLFLYGALGLLMVLVPYALIEAAGYSATGAAAALAPFAVVLAFSSRLMGAMAARVGPRIPLTVGPLVVAAGFGLATRISEGAAYWSEVFPAILTIAIGMAFAVAPLTTAVLSSVDARHTGSASGLNSAVARIGGLVATALVGGVLSAKGEALIDAFHIALAAAAGACLAAAASAALLLGGLKVRPPQP